MLNHQQYNLTVTTNQTTTYDFYSQPSPLVVALSYNGENPSDGLVGIQVNYQVQAFP